VKKVSRFVALGLVALILGSCATGVSKSFQFAPDSEKGLAMFGFTADRGRNLNVSFGKQNPDGTLALFSGESIEQWGGSDLRFYIVEFDPGTYVFRSVSELRGNTRFVSCLSDSTFSFNIEPGKLKYVGNIRYLARGAIGFEGNSNSDVIEAELANYPNIASKVETAALTKTSFPRGTDLFGIQKVCGGYNQKPDEARAPEG